MSNRNEYEVIVTSKKRSHVKRRVGPIPSDEVCFYLKYSVNLKTENFDVVKSVLHCFHEDKNGNWVYDENENE